MEITEEKYCSYYFALKHVYQLHKSFAFGESPDIPSGFSESLCRHVLNLEKGSDRTHDAIDVDGRHVEIKTTGSPIGKTTISNSNKFDFLAWMFIEFRSDSIHLYKIPRSLFSLNGGSGRSSISLKSIAEKGNIAPQTYFFKPLK